MVTGGRDYINRVVIYKVLDYIHSECEVSTLVHGDARGADSLAAAWADERSIDTDVHPADWRRYKNAAGMRRNADMLSTKPDLLVVFPGGKGTKGCAKMAAKRKIKIYKVKEELWT